MSLLRVINLHYMLKLKMCIWHGKMLLFQSHCFGLPSDNRTSLPKQCDFTNCVKIHKCCFLQHATICCSHASWMFYVTTSRKNTETQNTSFKWSRYIWFVFSRCCWLLLLTAAADCWLSDVTDTEQSKNLLQSERTASQNNPHTATNGQHKSLAVTVCTGHWPPAL